MNEQKLRQIEESYINGQKKQMVQQIKAYGIKAFCVDFLYYQWGAGADAEYGFMIYSQIVHTFFSLK